MLYTRIHDGDPLWLRRDIDFLGQEIQASDFPCVGSERHRLIIERHDEPIAEFVQGEEDWGVWVDEDGDEWESVWAGEFLSGDTARVENA